MHKILTVLVTGLIAACTLAGQASASDTITLETTYAGYFDMSQEPEWTLPAPLERGYPEWGGYGGSEQMRVSCEFVDDDAFASDPVHDGMNGGGGGCKADISFMGTYGGAATRSNLVCGTGQLSGVMLVTISHTSGGVLRTLHVPFVIERAFALYGAGHLRILDYGSEDPGVQYEGGGPITMTSPQMCIQRTEYWDIVGHIIIKSRPDVG